MENFRPRAEGEEKARLYRVTAEEGHDSDLQEVDGIDSALRLVRLYLEVFHVSRITVEEMLT